MTEATGDRRPKWIDAVEGEGAARIREFIAEFCGGGVRDYRKLRLENEDFFPAEGRARGFRADAIEWSGFGARKDSYFYSRLLEEAVRRYGKTHAFIDLCTGSAIPLLSVFGRGRPVDGFRAEAYDVDSKAAATAERNVRASGLDDRIAVGRKSISEFFSEPGARSLARKVLCANPPYVPYANEPVPARFIPVAAGADGLAHTWPFLRADYPGDARLVLEWSSLADPAAAIAAIRDRFVVEHAQAAELALGKYTRDPEIYSGLERLRREGKCVYGGDAEGGSQILFGVILRPRGNG